MLLTNIEQAEALLAVDEEISVELQHREDKNIQDLIRGMMKNEKDDAQRAIYAVIVREIDRRDKLLGKLASYIRGEEISFINTDENE